jgi:hypothetical protein
MAGMLLNLLGKPSSMQRARPHINLKEIDRYASFLQHSAIEKSTIKVYKTGARDYISFSHGLSFQPTPLTLSRYLAYSFHSIASKLRRKEDLSRPCHPKITTLFISPCFICLS